VDRQKYRNQHCFFLKFKNITFVAAILKSYSAATCLMNFTQPKSPSTDVIGALPLEQIHNLFPVPENKSSIFRPSKLKWLLITLNNASLDISVVANW
jgi:hypothetical protein